MQSIDKDIWNWQTAQYDMQQHRDAGLKWQSSYKNVQQIKQPSVIVFP